MGFTTPIWHEEHPIPPHSAYPPGDQLHEIITIFLTSGGFPGTVHGTSGCLPITSGGLMLPLVFVRGPPGTFRSLPNPPETIVVGPWWLSEGQ